MTDYLEYVFPDSPELADAFDELPLWSASFGLLLLEHLRLRPGMTVLDIGSGTGFPLLELAGRLGPGSRCYGVDPWLNANNRARSKANRYGLHNITIIDGSAHNLPLDDASVHLAVSNLGINNFDDPDAVLRECRRVLKPGGALCLTTNLNGHWQQFYDVFSKTLQQTGNTELIPALAAHQEHRGSVESVSALLQETGFTVARTTQRSFAMRFLNGTAFLHHYFVKIGFMGAWKGLVPEDIQKPVFQALEDNLNGLAASTGELLLTVPMLFMEGIKN